MLTFRLSTFARIICLLVIVGSHPSAGDAILVGYGHDAQWSDSGSFVSYIRSDSLFVGAMAESFKPQFVFAGPIYKYEWASDSEVVIQTRWYVKTESTSHRIEEIHKSVVGSPPVRLAGGATDMMTPGPDSSLRLMRYASGAVGYFVGGADQNYFALNKHQVPDVAGSNVDLFVRCDPDPWGPVRLHYGIGGERKRLTLDANHYLLPTLAPTRDKFMCSNSRGHVLVFDTSGHFLADIGRVDMEKWTSDGQWITFAQTEWGHYDLISSEIGIIRSDGSNRVIFTDSPQLEEEPVPSPDSRFVLYRVYKSDEIFVVSLEK